MEELKPSKILKCMQLCGDTGICTTNNHGCVYGDEGCLDCVDRLEADIQALIDAGDNLILRRAAPESTPLTCKSCVHHDLDAPWPEICFECRRKDRKDMYHSKPEGNMP